MKLAFCLFNYFPYGGLERDFVSIATECAKRGHQIDVYTQKWQGERMKSFNIHLIPPRGVQNHVKKYNFSQTLLKLLPEKSHDLVIGFNKIEGLDIYYAADVCYQDRINSKRHRLLHYLPRYRRLIALESAVFQKGNKTQILLISNLQKAHFIEYYQTEPERFYLLPPGINKARCQLEDKVLLRAQLRQQFQLTENDFLLLLVGSGFKTKGLDRALHALASLPAHLRSKTKLCVIGVDKEKPFLKLAKRLKISAHLHFLGGLPNVPQWMAASDLLIHPAYHENTGTVLLEAMVMGLPVLTTATCGYAHYVHEAKAGSVLNSPFSQADLNHQLEAMLISPERRRFAENGIRFTESADIYSLAKKAADFIECVGREREILSK